MTFFCFGKILIGFSIISSLGSSFFSSSFFSSSFFSSFLFSSFFSSVGIFPEGASFNSWILLLSLFFTPLALTSVIVTVPVFLSLALTLEWVDKTATSVFTCFAFSFSLSSTG